MSRKQRKKILRNLLLSQDGNKYLWPSLVMLCAGTLLLLLTVLLWSAFDGLLNGRNTKDPLGSTYLTISKEIQNGKLAEQKPGIFSIKEIDVLASLPQVIDVGIYNSASFPVEVSMNSGDTLSFSTKLFVEAVPDRFLFSRPVEWNWQQGKREIPVIVSREFLNLYNYGIAPNEGVPQLSEGTIRTLEFNMKVGIGLFSESYTAKVVGFSDRISSILVPMQFVEYGNLLFGDKAVTPPVRLIAQVNDPSDEGFVQFLLDRSYVTNNDLLRWNKLREVVNTVIYSIRILSVLLLLFGITLLFFFTYVNRNNNLEKVKCLLLLGYSPRYLHRFLFLRHLFTITWVMCISAILLLIINIRVARYLYGLGLVIDKFPTIEMWGALVFIYISLLLIINMSITRLLKE